MYGSSYSSKKRSFAPVVKGPNLPITARKLDFPPLTQEDKGNKKRIRPTTLVRTRKIEFDLFDEKLMNMRFDKKNEISLKSIPDKPSDRSMEIAFYDWKKKVKVIDSVGVGSSVFGDGFACLNLIKLTNTYQAHKVNMSLREFQKALPVMIELFVDCTQELCSFHKEKAYKEALEMRLNGKTEEADRHEEEADALFLRQMEEIRKRKNPFKET